MPAGLAARVGSHYVLIVGASFLHKNRSWALSVFEEMMRLGYSGRVVLAGPTMDLDGPVTLFRWRGATQPGKECVVAADGLERVLELPFGHGVDHPEGIALFAVDKDGRDTLLVVHDSASPSRQIGDSTLVAHVFTLPRRERPLGSKPAK